MPLSHLPRIALDELVLTGADTVVLTVNNRLARRLLTTLGNALATAGKSAAAAPSVLPYTAWVDLLAERVAFVTDQPLPAHRFDDFAARLVWQAVIEAEDSVLLNTGEASRLAADARSLIHEWRINPDGSMPHDEYEHFLHWHRDYLERLGACNADDADLRTERLLTELESVAAPLPRQIVLAGLRELSPRRKELFALLERSGCTLAVLHEPDSPTATLSRVPTADRNAEWRAATAWAVERLDASPGRFAIVAANLQDDAAFARRVLHARLPADAFNISVGRPLSEWPVARAALAWLKALAATPPYAPADLGAALLAGHCVAHASEAGQRARVDAEWRFRQHISIDEAEWSRQRTVCPRLAQAWPRAYGTLRARAVATADIWADLMRTSLDELGFPGDTPLDSTAYQVLDAFDDLLLRFATLAPAAGGLDAGAAVSLLARLAHDTPFQPERPAAARLDVVGLLEAEGERWDAVWILGLTDDVVPAAPAPNPLLPPAALAASGAPRATASRELLYAHDLFSALLKCAPEVVVSHALLEGERELRPSPLIAAVPEATQAGQASHAQPTSFALEQVEHDPGPPLAAGVAMRGGTGVLEAQSRNPLWAFARYRLGARELPAHPQQLPIALVRGNFLHQCMQQFWESLRTSRALAEARAAGTLESLLEHAVDQAASQELNDLSPAIRELERCRALRVLSQWLALEAEREPFEVISIEGSREWHRGPLQLTMRLDRVDRLANGGLAILDYKSGGRLDIKGWRRERPVTLQLPFYAAVLDDIQAAAGVTPAPVEALVLAQLTAREVGALGVGGTRLGMPGVDEPSAAVDDTPPKGSLFEEADWQTWLDLWQARTCALADEFIAGRADNIFVHASDLDHCEVMPFLRCRLDAATNDPGDPT